MRVRLFALTSAVLGCRSESSDSQLLQELAGTTLAVVCDGDYVAASYGNGLLAPVEAGYRDLLRIVSWRDGAVVTAELPLSNSVTAAPEVLTLSPDGLTAFVVERLGERPAGATMASQLPPGRRLFAVDLTVASAPRLAAEAPIDDFPEALALSPDGTRVAIVSNTPSASFVQLVRFGADGFGAVARFDVATLGVRGQAPGPRGGVLATNVHWHPSGRFMAVNFNTLSRVAFFELSDAAGQATLRPWGNLVETGRDPLVGRFTPDGRYYITSDWGRDFSATTIEGRLPNAPSSLSLIRVADPSASTPVHERIGSALSDESAEGIAVSPDGRLVATVNMRGTAFDPSSPRYTPEATVSLLSLDLERGVLEKLADYPFVGVLPEGGTFDATGEHFIATSFQARAGQAPGGSLEIFDVVRGTRPSLAYRASIAMPHGVHHVAVAGTPP